MNYELSITLSSPGKQVFDLPPQVKPRFLIWTIIQA